jgi:hypothetical protein
MKTQTPCPVCRQPVSIGTIIGASTPSRIRCKNCKSRLKPGPGFDLVFAILLGFTGLISFILGFLGTTMYLDGNITFLQFWMILIIVVVPLLIIILFISGYMVCNRTGLVAYGR